ncbi:glycosyltransferase family 2 protein [Algoriphagus sediminis]|uniref:Glycosyltransferase family 2 protein n=1 Tax=Algoriphagus sediminis TaxID=3057113 RepID=A0ABT7YDU9_9BACT|nr:glycosyltransferase family 2 protein [Algoriphagus sediminis]MDN3204698.1 glycosyltransferase family 2 protein [Algoriphagus sediminis]
MALVSVLMPVFNAETCVKESVQSVLNQTLQDFELIVVDDASTDNSLKSLSSFTDSRIKILSLQENLGIAGALNTGFAEASGKYILRMDADDVALPMRFERQVEYMETNPNIGLSGTLVEYFDGTLFNSPVENAYLKPSLLLDCPFAHPSVIIRKEVMDKYGLVFSGYLEDYQLWMNLSRITDFGLLPEVLLKYRQSENQFTAQNFEKRRKEANKLRVQFAGFWLKRELTEEEKSIVSVGPSGQNQNLQEVGDLCMEFLRKDPWDCDNEVRRVVKKLFLRNFYRSSKDIRTSIQILKNGFLTVKERLDLIKKSHYALFE